MKFIITDDRFDNTGTIYEFDSVEELLEEMMPAIKKWAQDDYNADTQNLSPEERQALEDYVVGKIQELKNCIEIAE